MEPGILSVGSVSPAGIGPGCLEDPFPVTLVTDREDGGEHSAALVDKSDPALLRWEKSPRLRRASPITYFMTEAVSQVLEGAPGIDRSRTGVVAAFFLGALVYSARFYRGINREGRRFASPILFPETVFNSPLSHVVSTLGIGGPVHSQIGDKSCWATALRTAECWLRLGEVDHVIVLGAEEFDPLTNHAFRASGLTRQGWLLPGEGAGALLLTSATDDCTIRLSRLSDGHGFGCGTSPLDAARSCLGHFPDNDPVLSTATSWVRPVEREAAGDRLIGVRETAGCEASTASAAWDTIRGISLLGRGEASSLVVPYWGLTRQFSTARFSRESPRS